MIIYVMLKLHEASRILHTVSDGWGEQVILLGIDHRELNLVIIVGMLSRSNRVPSSIAYASGAELTSGHGVRKW